MKLQSLFFTIACLASPVWADTQTEILSDKLDRLESEMALIQKKVYQAPGSESVPTKAPENIDEFYAALDAQTQNIQELTAKNEQLTHELTELKEQFNRFNEDINFRFKELKENPTAPAPDKKEAMTENDAYDKAYQFLKNGDYEKAEQSFLRFMEDYPDGKMIANANYWLGESYYARKKWNEAAGLFADGFTKYKESPKASDSMLKLGLTMKQLDKKKEACTAFKGLLDTYKDLDKTLQERAQKEIKELKCS